MHLIQHHIQKGPNANRPHEQTMLVVLECQSRLLLSFIEESPLSAHLKRLVYNYLQERQTYVDIRGTKSKNWKEKQGVPIEEELSPLLFNLYRRDISQPLTGIKLVSNVDSTILATGRGIPFHQLSCYLYIVNSSGPNKSTPSS